MKLLIKTSAAAIALFSIAACSGGSDAPEGDTVTETRMDEVDVLDGTISDDMANVDAEATTDEFLEEKSEGKSTDKSDKDKEAAEKEGSDEAGADGAADEADSQSESASDSEE